jgi:tRNA-dihydrouridine synthase B
LELAIQWKGEGLAITETRRHYGNYFRDFPNFKDYRMTLVTSNEVDELMATFDAIIEEYGPSLALV